MSVRLPSQKRFAPSRPKLGSRPGGPTVSGAIFAQPRLPTSSSTNTAAKASAATDGASAAVIPPATSNTAAAGPASVTHIPSTSTASITGTAIPSAQIQAQRRSLSPVKRSDGPTKSSTATSVEPTQHAAIAPRGRSRSPAHSPPITSTPAPSSSPLPPTLAPPPSKSPFTRPTSPGRASARDDTASARAPSVPPAPTSIPPVPSQYVPRISASPAPSISARQRSMSRQPSLAPSARGPSHLSLIAAAENRSTPLNLPPSAKERRRVEKAAEEAERESQRGTPAPISIPGLPPTLATTQRDENDVAGQTPRVDAAVVAERIVRGIGPPPAAASRPRSRTPMNLHEAGARQNSLVKKRKGQATPAGSDTAEEYEEYDEDGQPIRKKAKTGGKIAKGKVAPKAKVKQVEDPQKKRYNKAMAAKSKTPAPEGDEEDAEMNELDISDDENLTLDGPRDLSGPRDRQGGAKRKKRRVPKEPVFQPVNLDEVGIGELIGEVVDEENMQMGELATRRSGEGKVSERGKLVSVFIREYQKKNRTKLDHAANERYERRQVVRREVRAEKNRVRAERRGIVEENGGDPEVEVSDDEPDSETEFEIRPERLTPESSPEPGAVPRRVVGDGEADIEEAEYVEPPEGAAPMGEDDNDDDEEAEEDEPAANIEEEAFDANRHLANEGLQDGDDELNATLAGFMEETDLTVEELEAQIRAERQDAMTWNEGRVVIEDDDTGKMPNSASFAPKVPNERWSTAETELWYHVIGQTGENYTVMAMFFPGRSQKQLKNKGKKENNENPFRVDEAIRARRPIDKAYLEKTIGYDPRGPTQEADELIEQTRDLPARWTREDTDRNKEMADIVEEDKEEGARIEEENFEDLVEALGDDKGEDENMDEEEEAYDEEDKDDGEEEGDEQQDEGMEY